MAQVEQGGGKHNVSVELNLVPFIDLMSVLITFLLVTAVWTQVSMIQIGNSIYAKKTQDNVEPPPPTPHADIPFRVDVKDVGFRVVIGTESMIIAKKDGTYDAAALLTKVQKIKKDYPEKIDAVLTVDDEVLYEFMILGMDMILKGGFTSISVATSGVD